MSTLPNPDPAPPFLGVLESYLAHPLQTSTHHLHPAHREVAIHLEGVRELRKNLPSYIGGGCYEFPVVQLSTLLMPLGRLPDLGEETNN